MTGGTQGGFASPSASPCANLPLAIMVSIMVTMMGWLAQGCGRTSLLATDAGESAVAFTAGSDASATSQPTTDGGCPAGFTACGRGAATRCYDLSRAVDHCGQCGNACAPGIACQSSRCQQHQCQGALTFNALPAIPTLYKDTADSPPHFAFPAARTAISSSVTSTTTPNWISSILARVAGRSC